MRKFNPFRSKQNHESSRQTKTASTITTALKNKITSHHTNINTNNTTPLQPFTISAPIINRTDKVVINDKDHLDENSDEEQTPVIESDNNEEQIAILEESEKMSDEYNCTDDQPVSSLSTSSNQSSSSPKNTESPTTPTMVGNNPKEDVLTSCKATAMIYNDTQKKWVHCAPNGPAKVQLLFSPDTQTYRIVGRQIQDHEVVLNHSITKGIKYNQATPTFHQWRDQSCVYGLNFSTKLDAQEFGTTMMKILESVNGSANTSQTNANGGITLPSSTLNNNNNNNSATLYKRQTNQPSSSLPPTAPTVSINSTSTTSSSLVSEPQQQQQQQQQHSSSSYNNQLRPNSNSINSTSISTNNNHYSQQHQSTEEDETNYALISDSYSSYGDNSANKNNNIPQAPPFNSSMPTTGNTPPAAPPPPPPPPPPPLPNGFGSGPPPAPALVLPNANGNNGANTGRKSSTAAPQMDLMSEMAAKFAQRRKHVDENEKHDSNPANAAKGSAKAPTTSTLPAATAAPVQTSPRAARKTTESQPTPHYTSNDLEKLKADILSEIRKDIEKAKQEIITAILDHQKHIKK